MLFPKANYRIPRFYPVLKTLDQVVPVDYYMPGCPPESHQIAAVIELVIKVLHGEATLPTSWSHDRRWRIYRVRRLPADA